MKSKIQKNCFVIGALFFIILISLPVFVSAEENMSSYQKAVLCLDQSKQNFIDMQNFNFSVLRVNDSLKEMDSVFNAQVILKEKNKSYDFSLVFSRCQEIEKIKKLAYESRDEINALKKFYSESFSSSERINTSSIDLLISEAEQEIKNERYEKINSLIDNAYKEIVNTKTKQTTLNIFYETTSRSIKNFIYKNRYILISLSLALIVLFLILRKTIKKLLIKKKIKNLELRKKTLKDFVMKTQKEYFNEGKISEGDFNIRTKKLAELIRDIERQTPMMEEELAKINWKISKTK